MESTALTFGIEIEMIVPFLGIRSRTIDQDLLNPIPILRGDENSGSEGIRASIAQLLVDNGIDAISSNVKYDLGKPNIGPYGSKPWVVAFDNSLFSKDDRYHFAKIELQTPVMFYTEDYVAHLRRVCSVVAKNVRMEINKSCGLHIHIGDGNNGFTLGTLKKLVGFLWTFEKQLELIHPNHRLDNDFCVAPSKHSRLAKYGQLTSRKDGLARIFEIRTINEVVRLMQWWPDGRTAYSITNLEDTNWEGRSNEEDTYHIYQDGDDQWDEENMGSEFTKRTIEFRQHEGVDLSEEGVERIVSWLRVCEAIVRYARDQPRDVVESYLMSVIDRDDVTLLELLTLLHLEGDAEFYEMRFRQHKVNPDRN